MKYNEAFNFKRIDILSNGTWIYTIIQRRYHKHKQASMLHDFFFHLKFDGYLYDKNNKTTGDIIYEKLYKRFKH